MDLNKSPKVIPEGHLQDKSVITPTGEVNANRFSLGYQICYFLTKKHFGKTQIGLFAHLQCKEDDLDFEDTIFADLKSEGAIACGSPDIPNTSNIHGTQEEL